MIWITKLYIWIHLSGLSPDCQWTRGTTSYVTDADGNIAQHVECYFVDLISLTRQSV